MRVITGLARGRKLKTPTGYDVRPTTDQVKESMFNILMNDVEGRRVLDLFAGTGQLGIEAISRGAREVVFVDSSPESVKIVKDNLSLCGFEAPVLRTDALRYLDNCGKFDLIFLDPPYDSELYEQVLDKVNSIDLLNDGGIIVAEARRERLLPEMKAPYHKLREYNYGRLKICTYTKEISQ